MTRRYTHKRILIDYDDTILVNGKIEDWKVKVDYPVVAPDATIYNFVISNESVGFEWSGEVDVEGNVTQISVSGIE